MGWEKTSGEFRDWLNAAGSTFEKPEVQESPSALRTRNPDADKTTRPISADTAEAMLAGIVATLTLTPRTEVVDRFDDLPGEVQKSAPTQGGNESNTKGLFHIEVLYVVAGNHNSHADNEIHFALIGEPLRHAPIAGHGLRAGYGPPVCRLW